MSAVLSWIIGMCLAAMAIISARLFDPAMHSARRITPTSGYSVLLLLLAILTSTLTILPHDLGFADHLTGYLLMLHMFSGGAIVVLAPTVILLFAGMAQPCVASPLSQTSRCAFWIFSVGTMVTILTAFIAMTPSFGTEGQEVLILLHRIAAIIAVPAFIVFALQPISQCLSAKSQPSLQKSDIRRSES